MGGRAISEDSYVGANLIHTSSSSVIANGILLVDNMSDGVYTTLSETSPSLFEQSPSTPHSSNTTASVTFSATSAQFSNNEFLMNGTHVSWSNGTNPSYMNSSAMVGSYNLTLIAHNSTNGSLSDSITWIWTVGYEGGYAYAFRGHDKSDLWRYNISTDSWSSMANAPNKVKKGECLVFF